MLLTALLALVGLTEAAPKGLDTRQSGFTMLRFGCSQTVIDRIDPLGAPGVAPSPHMHQVAGGNAFNTSMASTDVSALASCTTCSYADDLSNYWTANMYFKHKNGTFKRVPQIPNRSEFSDTYDAGTHGGFIVYYVSPGKGKVTAFKPGFRMLVGNATQRAKIGSGKKTQSCYRCYSGPNFGGDNSAPCQDATLDTEGFPTNTCYGIRSNILFPTCWDGVNLDSPDHQSHVAYPTAGPSPFLGTTIQGTCPSTHPVPIPQLMLEVVWNTTGFNDKSQWATDTAQPFYLSTGDNSGYSQHADYVFGWKSNSLQTAMDDNKGCLGSACAGLKTQTNAPGNACTVSKKVNEDVDGWMTSLPGITM